MATIQEEMKAAYDQELQEATAELQLEMAAGLDSYLTDFASKFIEENKIAIDSGLRTEITESFMAKLHQVFVESFIEVPEAKVDIVESVIAEKQELEAIVEQSAETIELLETELSALKKDKVFSELAESMTAVELDKMKQLSEGVEYQNYDTFKEKLNVIRESYFTKSIKASPEAMLVEDALTGGMNNETAGNSQVSKYASFIAGNK